jgi:hypothetical protein
MKHLIEVARIVTKKKVRKIEIFDEQALKQKNSKFNEFYEAVILEKFQTDDDAAEYLYAKKSTDDRYRQLKSRFKKRLLNTLFFLDINQPSTSNYNRAYYSCNKDWTLVKILLANQAYETASFLARQIFNTAQKFKFADVIVNCSRILREHYSLIEKDDKEYEFFDKECKRFQNVQDAEIRSEEFYQRVVMNYYKLRPKDKELESKINTYCSALEGLSEIYDSPIVHYNKYMVLIFLYEMLGEYNKMLDTCSAAEKYVEDNPHYYREDKIGEVLLKRASALLHLQKTEFQHLKEKQRVDLMSSTLNNLVYFELWLEILEFHFLICCHSGKYNDALQIVLKAFADKRFNQCSDLQKEKWYIFEVYLNYLCSPNEDLILELSNANNKKRKKFKLKKFLSEPLFYPKSMRPLQAKLLIAQILFLIDDEKFQEANKLIEDLKVFGLRQLNKDEDGRLLLFLRLLQYLSKSEYKLRPDSAHYKYLEKLKQQPFKYRGLLNELEVVPYEKLWEILLSRLSKK